MGSESASETYWDYSTLNVRQAVTFCSVQWFDKFCGCKDFFENITFKMGSEPCIRDIKKRDIIIMFCFSGEFDVRINVDCDI